MWNDSWLISTLYRALININKKEFKNKSRLNSLRDNLEEILLNKKRYYTLLKRKADNQNFIKKIFDYAEYNENKLNLLLSKETKKFIQNEDEEINKDNILISQEANAQDSINRLIDILHDGDLNELNKFIPTSEYSIYAIINEALQEMKKNKVIGDFGIIENKNRKKTGLPMNKGILNEIYLYDDKKTFTLDVENSLKKQIGIIYKNIPWVYIFFVPSEDCIAINKLADTIIDELAKKVAVHLKKRLDELFPSMSS